MTVKRWIRADNGRLSQVIEYKNSQQVEIPINKDGSIKWLPEQQKQQMNGR